MRTLLPFFAVFLAKKGFLAYSMSCFLLLGASFTAFQASEIDPFTSPQERDFVNGGYGENDTKNILDATNPLDLMNRLRRATAMDDATSPSDAVDEALRALESKEDDPSQGKNRIY